MSKQAKIEAIREIVLGEVGLVNYLRISIQTKPTDEPRYYTKVPWNKNVDVVCADEAGAKMLEESLSSDIQRLPFNDRQQLYGQLENDGIEL